MINIRNGSGMYSFQIDCLIFGISAAMVLSDCSGWGKESYFFLFDAVIIRHMFCDQNIFGGSAYYGSNLLGSLLCLNYAMRYWQAQGKNAFLSRHQESNLFLLD